MSERSLQRRIAEQGASYRGLLDEAGQELGRHFLANGRNGIDEIAFLPVLQDTGSFCRARQVWEGVMPATLRSMN